MQTINLVNLENSGIKYKVFHFPDGEVQIELGEFSRKKSILVKCRITNAEELMILCQVMDILDRHEVEYTICIYYLMSMRMDRVMYFNRPFSLKIITNILNSYNCSSYKVVEPHSDKTQTLLKNFYPYYGECRPDFSGYQIVFPDAGAQERYSLDYEGDSCITCSKVRDEATGKILEIKIDNPENILRKPLMIIDDLCDGGGTFCGIAQAFSKLGITKDRLNISVVHLVNPKGIENLSKNFNHVWFTNSYKDWDNLPENVTMLKII
jgi:ribose-phosphate pyrophosphokinase